jgi:undecaprenyl-diphosphatase
MMATRSDASQVKLVFPSAILVTMAKKKSLLPAALRASLLEVERAELAVVRVHVRLGRHAMLRPAAALLNRLGGGWLYPLTAVLLFLVFRRRVVEALPSALFAVAGAHLLYPLLKRHVARLRPCDAHTDIASMSRALDKYSFPSGHCMTATAVAIPVATAFPEIAAVAAIVCVLIGWARLVAGHHYPTDLVAGMALGASVSAPITFAML